MNYALIIGIAIIVVLAGMVILNLLKSVIKALFLISLIIALLLAGLSYYVYTDVMELRQRLPVDEKIFLLEDEGTIIAAMSFKDISSASYRLYDHTSVREADGLFAVSELDTIKGDAYKVFIVKLETFNESEDLRFEGVVLSYRMIDDLLGSETPKDDFVALMIEQGGYSQPAADDLIEQLDRELEMDDSMFRGLLFQLLIGNYMSDAGPVSVVSQIKNSNIQVYPETAAFKLIRFAPMSLVKGAAGKLKEDIAS